MKQSLTVWISTLAFGISLRFVPYVKESEIAVWLLVALCALALKRLVYAQCTADTSSIDTKTALITGASTGIGRALGTYLTQKGAGVLWAARSRPLLVRNVAEAGGVKGVPLQLDLADRESIRGVVKEVKERGVRLHYVFLNAAYLGPKRLTGDGVEQNFAVNHLGHMYLVYLLLKEELLAHGAAIVVVASDLHRMCPRVRFDDLFYDKAGAYKRFGLRAYNQSKLINVMFARRLAALIKEGGCALRVTSAHPGTPVHTELLRTWTPAAWLMNKCFAPLVFLFARYPIDGAQTLMQAAFDRRSDNGAYYENCSPVRPSAAAHDDAAADRIWRVSCDMLGIEQDWSKELRYLATDENAN